MAGAGLTLTLEGLADVERRLARVADQLGDLSPLMDILGTSIESDIHENFKGEHSPAGVPWPKSQRAMATGGKTLTDTAILRNSITHNAGPRSVEVGTNVVYARRHDQGFDGTEQIASHKRTMRSVFGVALAEPITVTVKAHSRKAKTPQRQFIGISRDGEAEIRGQVADWLELEA